MSATGRTEALRRRSAVVAGVLASLSLFALVVVSGPARAQQDCNPAPEEPYSGGRPPCEEPNDITLTLSLSAGPAGTPVDVKASGYDVGDRVSVSFAGQVLVTATATSDGGSGVTAAIQPARLLGLAQAAPRGAISETIVVPNVAPATYDVCVAAEGAKTACSPFRVTSTAVAGVSFSRDTGGASVLGRVGGLARTGWPFLPFLLLAVILIVLGRYLMAKSRSRRV